MPEKGRVGDRVGDLSGSQLPDEQHFAAGGRLEDEEERNEGGYHYRYQPR